MRCNSIRLQYLEPAFAVARQIDRMDYSCFSFEVNRFRILNVQGDLAMKRCIPLFMLLLALMFSCAAAERTVYPDQGGVAVFVEDGKCGLINSDGEIILDAEYDSIEPFDGKRFTVVHQDRWSGIIRSDGTVVHPCDAWFIDTIKEPDIVSIRYEDERNCCIMDIGTGEILLEDAGNWCGLESGFYCIRRDEVSEIYDDEMNLLLTLPGSVSQIQDGWIIMYDGKARCNNIYDMQGNLLYGSVNLTQINNGRVFYVRSEEDGTTKRYYYGIIHPDGSRVEKTAEEYTCFFGTSYPYCLFNSKKAWFVDDQCEPVIPAEYDQAYGFCYGSAFVQKDGGWMLIDDQGQCIDNIVQNFSPLSAHPNISFWAVPSTPIVPITIGEDVRLIDRQGNFVNENTYSVGNMGYMDLFLDKWMILGDQDGIVAIINGETGEACFDYPIEN